MFGKIKLSLICFIGCVLMCTGSAFGGDITPEAHTKLMAENKILSEKDPLSNAEITSLYLYTYYYALGAIIKTHVYTPCKSFDEVLPALSDDLKKIMIMLATAEGYEQEQAEQEITWMLNNDNKNEYVRIFADRVNGPCGEWHKDKFTKTFDKDYETTLKIEKYNWITPELSPKEPGLWLKIVFQKEMKRLHTEGIIISTKKAQKPISKVQKSINKAKSKLKKTAKKNIKKAATEVKTEVKKQAAELIKAADDVKKKAADAQKKLDKAAEDLKKQAADAQKKIDKAAEEAQRQLDKGSKQVDDLFDGW